MRKKEKKKKKVRKWKKKKKVRKKRKEKQKKGKTKKGSVFKSLLVRGGSQDNHGEGVLYQKPGLHIFKEAIISMSMDEWQPIH